MQAFLVSQMPQITWMGSTFNDCSSRREKYSWKRSISDALSQRWSKPNCLPFNIQPDLSETWTIQEDMQICFIVFSVEITHTRPVLITQLKSIPRTTFPLRASHNSKLLFSGSQIFQSLLCHQWGCVTPVPYKASYPNFFEYSPQQSYKPRLIRPYKNKG